MASYRPLDQAPDRTRTRRAALDRHLATRAGVLTEVHLAHTARAYLLDDLVGTEGCADHVSPGTTGRPSRVDAVEGWLVEHFNVVALSYRSLNEDSAVDSGHAVVRAGDLP